MYYLVLVGSQRYRGSEPLTYSSQEQIPNGSLVQVPLGKQTVTGIVLRKTAKPDFPVKPVTFSRIDAKVSDEAMLLLRWVQAYYLASLGQTVELFTVPALSQKKPMSDAETTETPALTNKQSVVVPPLTDEQTRAIKQINSMTATSVLLQGITGSGKTRIYLELAKQTLQDGRSVLVLTPEIGLTKPLAEQFKSYFSNEVIVQHSGLTPADRRQQWLKVAGVQEPIITVGARSALFLPHKNLGLIVVDEAHDTSYKQSQSPRYNALRVAGKLRDIHKATLVLGSATPLVSERYQFEALSLPIIELNNRAIASTHGVQRTIIDSRDRSNFSQSPHLSDQLIDAIRKAVTDNEQSLLFLNKRGSARMVLCQSCGWRAVCRRCDTSLTFHADVHRLLCHSCDTTESVPTECPECQNPDILFKSIGTKSLEEEVQRLFPDSTVGRFDGDTHKTTGLVARANELQKGDIDIIIGTQTVTKGFDLPLLSVVGIVQADTSLGMPDFTAQERTFQLISQVGGRIGRGHRQGRLVVQTYSPESKVIQMAVASDYEKFYETELHERQVFQFPPFVHLATITCARASQASAMKACSDLKLMLITSNPTIRVDGPAPHYVEKLRNKYFWQLVLRAKKRADLIDALGNLPSGWTYDIDPIDLL